MPRFLTANRDRHCHLRRDELVYIAITLHDTALHEIDPNDIKRYDMKSYFLQWYEWF
jgi:hypothetical protein